jgi:8-oxo-dGTP diphosphatase
MNEIRVVAAVLVREGCVLAARRGPGRKQAGLWELPGGKVEPGETDQQALVRELDEELGIRASATSAIAENLHHYDHVSVRLIAVPATMRPDEEPEARDHDALRWLPADQLHTVTWAPADIPLLVAVRATLAKAEVA